MNYNNIHQSAKNCMRLYHVGVLTYIPCWSIDNYHYHNATGKFDHVEFFLSWNKEYIRKNHYWTLIEFGTHMNVINFCNQEEVFWFKETVHLHLTYCMQKQQIFLAWCFIGCGIHFNFRNCFCPVDFTLIGQSGIEMVPKDLCELTYNNQLVSETYDVIYCMNKIIHEGKSQSIYYDFYHL